MAGRPTGPQTNRIRRFGAARPLEDLRLFLLSHSGEPEAGGGDASIPVTIRVLGDEVEVELFPKEGELIAPGRFADWFRGQLREQNMTQQAAAHRLGVSGKTVNRWVQGHTEPRMRELRRVQEVFGALPSL
jgi:DNA-binding XRE family transcriptional regulator